MILIELKLYMCMNQVKIDRNKYLTLNRCPLGNYELKKKTQNNSDQTAFKLFT